MGGPLLENVVMTAFVYMLSWGPKNFILVCYADQDWFYMVETPKEIAPVWAEATLTSKGGGPYEPIKK